MDQRPAKPMTWELTSAARTPHLGAVLRLGARAIPVADIKGFIGTSDREADKKPAFATLVVFCIAALFFLLGVLDIGWRQRFLVATCLFGFIAVSALHDMAWLTTSCIYRVEVITRSGETVRYATIDPSEHAALLDVLARVGAQLRAANDDAMIAA